MTGLEPFPEYASKQRSKRTWAIRLAAGFVGLAAVGYAAMPWWLPTDWLSRRLVNQLSADLKRTVSIEQVRVGWVEGLVFEGITVADRPGSVYPMLAKIGRLRCDFEPLTTLLTGRVDEIVVDEPTFYLVADENGRLNISDLGERQEGALPARSFLIRDLRCHVHTPRGDETIRFDRLQCSVNPDTGKLRFMGEVRPQQELADNPSAGAKQLRIDAEITVPRLKSAVTLGGNIKVQWAGLALSDLPLKVIPRIPIEQVDGTTTGTLQIETQADLNMRFVLDVALHGVRIRRLDHPQTAQVPDATVQTAGRWDPNTDVVLLESLAYETKAIRLSGKGDIDKAPALRVDLDGAPPMEVHVAGMVKNWERLRQEWPAFERAAARAGVTLEGKAEFKLDGVHEQWADHATIVFDAPQTLCRVKRDGVVWLDAPRGIAKHIEAGLNFTSHDGRGVQSDVSLTLGSIAVQGGGEVKLPDANLSEPMDRVQAWLDTVIPSARGQCVVRCGDLAELGNLSPRLASVELLRGWRGPFAATLVCSPKENVNRVSVAVNMEGLTVVQAGDLFEKEAGQPLAMQIGCDVPASTGSRLSGLVLVVTHGPASLRLGEGAKVDYRFAFTGGGHGRDVLPISMDASWHLPVRLADIEQLGRLWPGWERVFVSGGKRRVTGSTDVVLDGMFSSHPRDRVMRYAVELNVDDVAAQWDDWLDKPAGAALKVSANCRREELEGRGDTGWNVAVHRPSGDVAVSFRQGDPGADGADLEHARVQADVSDVASFLALSPRLRREVDAYRPTGGFSVEFDSLSTAGGRAIELSFDATRAGCELPVSGVLMKSPGVDAKMTARLHTVSPSRSPETVTWRLEEGELHLAGLHLSEVAGTAESAVPVSQPAVAVFLRMLRPEPMPSLRAIDVEAYGGLVIDGQVTALHRKVRQWCERYGLGGRVGVRANVTGTPEQLVVAGVVDADNLQCSTRLGGDLVPTIAKPMGIPSRLTFEVSLANGSRDKMREIQIDALTLDLSGNEIGVTGNVGLPSSLEGAASPGKVDLRTQLHLSAMSNLMPFVPGSRISQCDGSCEGGFEIVGTSRDWAVREGSLAFGRFGAVVGGDNMGLDGQLQFGDGKASLDQFRWVFGASEGVVSGSVSQEGESYMGRLSLAIDRLDVPDLTERIAHWVPAEASSTTNAADQADRADRGVVETLLRSELAIDAYANECRAMLPGNQSLQADEGYAKIQIQRGPVKIDFRALVDGGLVTGEFNSHTQVAEPQYHLTYTADSILPGPLVEGYLRLMFPGMIASGPLTLIDETYQKLFPLPGDPNYEVGEGELIIHGGSIAGRAAPLWVTRIFPGLNFARFEFSYMHSWFKKLPNGQVHHQMIYQGQYYNVYMIGYADQTRFFRYEVGVDFLADFDSKYWADTGQGRIPLFVKTGRIDDRGKLIEEEVNYVSPERVMRALFVENNPVVTAYYAVLQRVKGDK